MALPCWRDNHAERQPNDRGYGPLLQVFIQCRLRQFFAAALCKRGQVSNCIRGYKPLLRVSVFFAGGDRVRDKL